MSTLRRTTKADKLVALFEQVGDIHPVTYVCEVTEITNYNSLKAFCSYIRKAKHIPEENRVDIRIKDEKCIRRA